MLSLILRRTLNEIVSVFWSSRKLFSALLLRLVALVVHLKVFLIKHFESNESFQFYVVESTMAFCGICVVLGNALSIILL